MYRSHFRLNQRPFASAPNPEHYFPASSIEQAREMLAINIERASGISMVMGPVGSGKSLLCQLLASQFAGELPVCMISSGRIRTREVLLQQIVHGLGLPYHGLGEGDLRLTLRHHVEGQSCVKGILLIIDEAERLPLDLLEEIRALTNLAKEGQPSVRLVLVGTHRLEERVGNPKLESLNQRIVGRLFVDNFTREETSDYIRARISASGGDATAIFADEAFSTVYDATNGVPRLINQICDHALLMAAINGVNQITSHGIEAAWADLQQIPMPLGDTVEVSEGSSTVIEFGALDEWEDKSSETLEVSDQLEIDVALPPDEIAEISDRQIPAFDQSATTSATDDAFAPKPQDYDLDAFSPTNTSEYRTPTLEDIELRESPFADEPDFVADAQLMINATQTGNPFDEMASYATSQPIESDVEEIAETSTIDSELIVSYSADETLADSEQELSASEQSISSSDSAAATLGDSQSESDWSMDDNPDSEYQLAPETPDENGENISATESWTQTPEPDADLSIEFATNPFDEEFDEEEIVIQQFASPSQLARGERDNVSSAYSQHLASQLRAAHPGLRMHDASSEMEEQPEVASASEDANEFRRLSAFYEGDDSITANADDQSQSDMLPATGGDDRMPSADEGFEDQGELISNEHAEAMDSDTHEAELAFDPASDPVMPEDSIQSLATDHPTDDETERLIDSEPLAGEPVSQSASESASQSVTSASYPEDVDAVTDLSDIELFDSLADSDDQAESSIASSISDMQQAVQQDFDASQPASDEMIRTEESHGITKHSRTRKTAKRRFRTLFSSMRRI